MFNVENIIHIRLSHPRILKTLCRKITLPEEFDYRQLARLTPGFVGADLMALCREAAMSAVNRILLQPNSADATPPVPQTYTSQVTIICIALLKEHYTFFGNRLILYLPKS